MKQVLVRKARFPRHSTVIRVPSPRIGNDSADLVGADPADRNDNMPRPWLGYFRTSDLEPCIVESDVSIMVPCADIPTAIKNLAADTRS